MRDRDPRRGIQVAVGTVFTGRLLYARRRMHTEISKFLVLPNFVWFAKNLKRESLSLRIFLAVFILT